MNFEPEHDAALREAIAYLGDIHGVNIFFLTARDLIEEFLKNLDSEDRDFSDEMLQARKTFKKLTAEQPDECPSKLWDDALASVGRSGPMKWHESIDWEKHMPDGSVVFSAEQYQMLSTFHLAVVGLLNEINSMEDIPDDASHRADAIGEFNCEMLAAGIFQDRDVRKEMERSGD